MLRAVYRKTNFSDKVTKSLILIHRLFRKGFNSGICTQYETSILDSSIVTVWVLQFCRENKIKIKIIKVVKVNDLERLLSTRRASLVEYAHHVQKLFNSAKLWLLKLYIDIKTGQK